MEYRPYFILGDLWDSFQEWSAYGVSIPLVLDSGDCVVQYYVPSLSGIQLYGEATKQGISTGYCSFFSQSILICSCQLYFLFTLFSC